MPLDLDTLTRAGWVRHSSLVARPARSPALQEVDDAVDAWAQVAGGGDLVGKRARIEDILRAVSRWFDRRGQVSKRRGRLHELRIAAIARRKQLDLTDGAANAVVAVHLLDGDEWTYSAGATQIVNLPADEAWVARGGVTSVDRLSRGLRVKIELRKTATEMVTLRLLAHRDNATYSPAEQGRRPAYAGALVALGAAHGEFTHALGAAIPVAVGDSHVAVAHISVPAAVGNRYVVEATDIRGNVVYSQEIRTRRKIFAMVSRYGQTRHEVDPARLLTAVATAYAPHTEVVALGVEDVEDAPQYDIYSDLAALQAIRAVRSTATQLQQRFTYADYEPFLAQFVLADHLPSSTVSTSLPVTGVAIGPGAPVVRVPMRCKPPPVTDPTADMRKVLWIGLGVAPLDGHSATVPGNPWFVGAKVRWTDGSEAAIAVGNCAPVETDPGNRPGMFNEVDVRVDNLPVGTGQGEITVTAILVQRMINGVARKPQAPGAMLLASRQKFVPVGVDEQISATIHELGHALGMNGEPVASGLDAHANFYSHNGEHCHAGVAAKPADDQYHADAATPGQATCVMYGLITSPPRFTFCADCQLALRKLDVERGLLT